MASSVPRVIGDNPETRRFLDSLARDLAALQTTVGSPAPASASYVTAVAEATLSARRVLTAGSGISLTDGGAGSTLTVASTVAIKTFSIIGSSAASGASVTISSLTSSPFLIVVLSGMSHNSGGSEALQVAVSDDGSTFDTATTFTTAFNAASVVYTTVMVFRTSETAAKVIAGNGLFGGVQSSETGVTVALRFTNSGGASFDAGNIYVYGFN